MEQCVYFRDYDKISDDLMYFGSGISLRFNVTLAKKGNDGRRHHFLNVYRYDSKYDDYGKVLTVRRHFDYYLSIDIKDNFAASIMITNRDILNVRMRLKQVYSWFTNQIFRIDKKKKLHIVGSPGQVSIRCTGDKYLIFEPTIITYDNNQQREGVRMILSDSTYVDYNIDTFMEFMYLIGSINMYECASIMVGYIQPDLSQVVDIDKNNIGKNIIDEDTCDATIKVNHIVQDKSAHKNKSFFDKLDELGE